MWVAIRAVTGKEGVYSPGDAVPEAVRWRNPRIWTRWIKEVPDSEVVGGRWTRYEAVMLRGAKPAAKPTTPPPQPAPPVAPVAPVEPKPEPAAVSPADVQPDSAPQADATEDERPKQRKRRSTFIG